MSINIINHIGDYSGDNPYLKELKNKSFRGTPLNDFELSYIEHSLNFTPRWFETTLLSNFSENDKEYLKETFNSDEPIEAIKANILIGETDSHYHLGYKATSKSKLYTYFIEKNFSLVNEIYYNYDVDFTKVDSILGKKNRFLYEHQKLGVKFLLANKKTYLFDGAGAGKTYTSISAALLSGAKKILVICLSNLKENWKNELAVFGETAKVIEGQTGWIEGYSKFTIINFDIIQYYTGVKTKSKETCKHMLDYGFDYIIIDEAHRVKSPKTQVSKGVKKLCHGAKYVCAMTATPFEKAEELFFLSINCNISIGDIIPSGFYGQMAANMLEDYRLRYCYGYKIVPKNSNKKPFMITGKIIDGVKQYTSNIKELKTRIQFGMLRRTLRDIFPDFVGIYREKIEYELNTKQRQKYNEYFDAYNEKSIEQKGIDLKNIRVGEDEFLDLQNLVEPLLLRKFLATEMVKNTVASAKADARLGKKIIIFTHFNEENEKIIEMLNKSSEKAILVHASMTHKKQALAIKNFQTDDKYQFIVGNIKTLGTGHNIQRGDVIYYNSINWNSGEHEQGEGRAWRIGRDEDVEVNYMVFKDTVSEDVFNASFAKQQSKYNLIGGNTEDSGFE